MPTLLSMALGAPPIFGGALPAAAAGQSKGPSPRGILACVMTAGYTLRGLWRGAAGMRRRP